MARTHTLTHPNLLGITKNGRVWQGVRTDWFPTAKLKRAGSAPATAAMLVNYLARSRSGYRRLFPSQSCERTDLVKLMGTFSNLIPTGLFGLATMHPFVRGLNDFAEHYGVALPIRTLDVPSIKAARPSFDQCVAFIQAGLDADSPVVWYNVDNANLPTPRRRQWVLITSLVVDGPQPTIITYCEDGKLQACDFRQWFHDTRRGGGLLFVGRA